MRWDRRTVLAVVATVVGVLLAALVTSVVGDDAGDGAPTSTAPTSTAASSGSPDGRTGETDPESGLAWIAAGDLPAQARDTLDLIDRGGPYPFPDHDDGVFGNREALLPARAGGYYREYTVPTPGSPDRGARRIVAGSGGELYWTADHYASFERVSR